MKTPKMALMAMLALICAPMVALSGGNSVVSGEPGIKLPVPFGESAALIRWEPLPGEDIGGFTMRWGLQRGTVEHSVDVPCLLTNVVTCFTNVEGVITCATNTRTLVQPTAGVISNLPPDVPVFVTVAGYNILGEEGPASQELAFVSWSPQVPPQIQCEKAVLPGEITTSVLITNAHTRLAVSKDLERWEPLAEVFIVYPIGVDFNLVPSVMSWTFSSHLNPRLFFRVDPPTP